MGHNVIHRVLLFGFVLLPFLALSQQRGQIVKAGDNVLDPNQDGWVSESNSGFSTDGYYVDEFEFNMFGMPTSAEGEAINDIQNGSACGTTDLAVDSEGVTAYGVLDDFGNLIFRFRLAGDRPSIEAYTVLIDADGKLGDDDLNATPNNPGFEIDITLIENKGVLVYDLDGIDSCPAEIFTYDVNTHYQRSIAGTESCGDADYFLDFYVPFTDLIDEFDVSLQTEMRFFAVTNISATCAMGGSISDVGGVDDREYAGCNVCAFQELSDSQCPTTLEDLCSTCEGFSSGSTPKPTINAPVKVGETALTGTAEPEANIFIDVYDETKTLVDQDTTTASLAGDWSSLLDVALQQLDSITARAQLEGGCTSGISESDVSFAVVIINTAPVLTGSGGAIDYNENSGALAIDAGLDVTDIDDTELENATVRIIQNLQPTEDLLVFTDQNNISGSYDTGTGVLSLMGTSSLSNYITALRSISYQNDSEDPNNLTRRIQFIVNDGLDDSNVITRDINVIPLNDAPEISGTATPLLYANGDGAVIIDNLISITDIDDTDIAGATVSISNNYVMSDDVLAFVDQNGITGTFDAPSGVLTLSNTASIADYITALTSITYEKTGLTSQLTRRISFVVSDGDQNSQPFNVDIDIDGSNQPPIIMDGGISVTTIPISTNEDTAIDICIEVVDPDGDMTSISSAVSLDGTGIITLDPDNTLCFNYNPPADFTGQENLQVEVCDLTVSSLCDQVNVVIDVLPVNDPPEIIVTGSMDTVRFTTTEETVLNACLTATDPDLDAVNLVTIDSKTNQGLYDLGATDLCFEYTPGEDFSGEEISTLTVCDTGTPTLCDEVVAVIDVTPVNDPPLIVDEASSPVDTLFFQTKEDFTLGICIDINDPDFGPWEITSIEPIESLGSVELSIVNELCYTFFPEPDVNGRDIRHVVVCDDASAPLCDTVVVVVDITSVNDEPIIEEGEDETVVITDEDTPTTFCIAADDVDLDQLNITQITASENGEFIATADSLCYIFNPDENIHGTEEVTVTVCDDGDPMLCDDITVTLEITPVNDPPIAVDDQYVGLRNRTVTGNVLDNDSDIEGHNLTIDLPLEPVPLNGTLEMDENGDFTYTPDMAFFGEVVFSYVVCDSGDPSACSAASVFITIENIELLAYQGFSPNGDGNNDYWRIEGIDLFLDNLVRVYDRYNNIVFEISGYNNADRVWRGEANKGVSNKDMPEGTYFYVINLGDGDELVSGFVVVKRN